MVQFPNDSFPGPLKRVRLQEKYPATQLDGDASPDDIVARKLSSDEIDETTLPSEENDHERKKRSFLNKIIFTRVGIYRMIESRLKA